ncbi:hypothetical protein TNCV_4464481 [Trichonephila clavipes]|nr:hypothetical protein TNCV_4464481 [Trichonephila clavipes]
MGWRCPSRYPILDHFWCAHEGIRAHKHTPQIHLQIKSSYEQSLVWKRGSPSLVSTGLTILRCPSDLWPWYLSGQGIGSWLVLSRI